MHLKGVIFGLSRTKENYKDTNQYYKCDVIIFKHEVELTDLTRKLTPDLLIEEMMGLVDLDF